MLERERNNNKCSPKRDEFENWNKEWYEKNVAKIIINEVKNNQNNQDSFDDFFFKKKYF
jgi:hypothetical protein